MATPGGYGGKPPGVACDVSTGARNIARPSTGDRRARTQCTPLTLGIRQGAITTLSRESPTERDPPTRILARSTPVVTRRSSCPGRFGALSSSRRTCEGLKFGPGSAEEGDFHRTGVGRSVWWWGIAGKQFTGGRVRATGHIPRKGAWMSAHTYRVTEIVGTSQEGVDQAIRNGIARASSTLRGLDWFEVTEVRGHIDEGQVAHFQVGLKVGFRLES